MLLQPSQGPLRTSHGRGWHGWRMLFDSNPGRRQGKVSPFAQPPTAVGRNFRTKTRRRAMLLNYIVLARHGGFGFAVTGNNEERSAEGRLALQQVRNAYAPSVAPRLHATKDLSAAWILSLGMSPLQNYNNVEKTAAAQKPQRPGRQRQISLPPLTEQLLGFLWLDSGHAAPAAAPLSSSNYLANDRR